MYFAAKEKLDLKDQAKSSLIERESQNLDFLH